MARGKVGGLRPPADVTVVIVVYPEVVLNGDAVDARIINRRAIGQSADADAEHDLALAIMRPNAEQTQDLIAMIALAVIPDDHAGPSRSAHGLRSVAEDALEVALSQFGQRVKGVQQIENVVLRRSRFFLFAGAAEGTAALDVFQNVLVALILVFGGHDDSSRLTDGRRL